MCNSRHFRGPSQPVRSEVMFQPEYQVQAPLSSVGFPINFYDQSGMMAQQGVPFGYQLPAQSIRVPYEYPMGFSQGPLQEASVGYGRPRPQQMGAGSQTRPETYDNLNQSIPESEKLLATDSRTNGHLKNSFPFLQKEENIVVKVMLNPMSLYQSAPPADQYLGMTGGLPWSAYPFSVNPYMPMMSVAQPQMMPPFMSQMQMYGGYPQPTPHFPVNDGVKISQDPRGPSNNQLESHFTARQERSVPQPQLTMPVWPNNGVSERQVSGMTSYRLDDNGYKEPKKTFETTILNDARHLEIHKAPSEPAAPTLTKHHQNGSIIVSESRNISFPTPIRPRPAFRVEPEPLKVELTQPTSPPTQLLQNPQPTPTPQPLRAEPAKEAPSPKVNVTESEPEEESESESESEPSPEPSVTVKKTRKYTRRPPVIREVIDKPFKRVRHPPKADLSPKQKIRKIKKTMNRYVRGRSKEPVERVRQPRKILPSAWNDTPVIQVTSQPIKAEVSVHPIIPKHLEGVLELITWTVPEPNSDSPQKICREIRPNPIRVESEDPPSPLGSQFSQEKILNSMVKKVGTIWSRRPTNLPNVFNAIYRSTDDPHADQMVWQTTDYSNKKISNMQEEIPSDEFEEESDD